MASSQRVVAGNHGCRTDQVQFGAVQLSSLKGSPDRPATVGQLSIGADKLQIAMSMQSLPESIVRILRFLKQGRQA
jgi:hypothetical protein